MQHKERIDELLSQINAEHAERADEQKRVNSAVLRKHEARARKAEAEAAYAELVLEVARKQAATLDLPVAAPSGKGGAA